MGEQTQHLFPAMGQTPQQDGQHAQALLTKEGTISSRSPLEDQEKNLVVELLSQDFIPEAAPPVLRLHSRGSSLECDALSQKGWHQLTALCWAGCLKTGLDSGCPGPGLWCHASPEPLCALSRRHQGELPRRPPSPRKLPSLRPWEALFTKLRLLLTLLLFVLFRQQLLSGEEYG